MKYWLLMDKYWIATFVYLFYMLAIAILALVNIAYGGNSMSTLLYAILLWVAGIGLLILIDVIMYRIFDR